MVLCQKLFIVILMYVMPDGIIINVERTSPYILIQNVKVVLYIEYKVWCKIIHSSSVQIRVLNLR
jgi:protein associated with RNAse G/E